MFQKILIANRGEIALRIIRSCKELKIPTVAVHSESDQDSLHVRFADEAVCIGSDLPNESYLNIPRIISAAEIMNADAVHPGYGFLAENPHFAEVCESCNISFIGPQSRAIRLMGDKSEARKTVAASKVPTIPGTEDTVPDEEAAVEASNEVGFPLVIKASAGGGGKGIRIVHNPEELREAFRIASREAQNAFNNPALYLERYIEKARHIEVQILGDQHGHVIHLGERDCSIQRRRQKLIEESPSPFVDQNLRKNLGEAALRAAKAIDYENAGTVEFLVTDDSQFYFMEMNTRIQVEHPVTEMVVSQDLVKEQILVAAGAPLGFTQKEVKLRGHAIECRINAEDPDRNFMPSTGEITSFHTPGGYGVRVDSHVHTQYVVTPYYDSMLAKLIVWGKDREEALTRTERALDEFVIEGIKTTIPFHKFMLKQPTFRSGNADTDFVESMSHKS